MAKIETKDVVGLVIGTGLIVLSVIGIVKHNKQEHLEQLCQTMTPELKRKFMNAKDCAA